MASDSGVMNITAARLLTIWCAAAATVPWRETNSAIRVNEVTSTMMVRPAGTPMRAKRPMAAQSGGSIRDQMA